MTNSFFQAGNQSPTIEISFVKDLQGNILNGWLHLSVSINIPFHYVAIWVVTDRNEVYGTFIFDTNRSLKSCNYSIVFVISVVGLYQALHENLYYGFGPMSCTHDSLGKFITSHDSEEAGKCNK